MIPTPSATATMAAEAASGGWDWSVTASFIAAGIAAVAAFLSGWSVVATKRASARDNAIARFTMAVDNMDNGLDHRVALGLGVLGAMTTSKWLSKEDQEIAVLTLRAYNRPKSTAGGVRK